MDPRSIGLAMVLGNDKLISVVFMPQFLS